MAYIDKITSNSKFMNEVTENENKAFSILRNQYYAIILLTIVCLILLVMTYFTNVHFGIFLVSLFLSTIFLRSLINFNTVFRFVVWYFNLYIYLLRYIKELNNEEREIIYNKFPKKYSETLKNAIVILDSENENEIS